MRFISNKNNNHYLIKSYKIAMKKLKIYKVKIKNRSRNRNRNRNRNK